MDSQTNAIDNSEVQAQVELVEIETATPIVTGIDTVSVDAGASAVAQSPAAETKPESTESQTIPVGKIVLGILALDAVWTLICSITPTIVVYQAALIANTNPVLVALATGSSFVTLFISNFLFNLFFAFCFSFVFGGGAFVFIVAGYSIFGKKQLKKIKEN